MFHIENLLRYVNETAAVPLRKYGFFEGHPIFTGKVSSSATEVRDAIFRTHVAEILTDLCFGLVPHVRVADDHGPEIGLANAAFRDQPDRMMARLSPRHVFALLLAVFVTVGVSVSAVQGSTMAVNMTMTAKTGMAMTSKTYMTMADMGAATDSDCKACLKGAGDNGNPMHCPPSCVAPVLAVLPLEFAAMTVIRAPLPSALPTPFLHGRSSLPDPFPPKSIDLV